MSMELAEAVELAGAVAGGFAGRLEVLEGPSGRRRWTDDVKARIVEAATARADIDAVFSINWNAYQAYASVRRR